MRDASVLVVSLALLVAAGCAEEAAAPQRAPVVPTEAEEAAPVVRPQRPERAERTVRRTAEPSADEGGVEAGAAAPGSEPLAPELESRLREELLEIADDDQLRYRRWGFGGTPTSLLDLDPFGPDAEARLWYLLDTLEPGDPLLRGVQRVLGDLLEPTAEGTVPGVLMARLQSDQAGVRARGLGIVAFEWDCPPKSAAEVGRMIRSGLTSADEDERRSAAVAAGRLTPLCGDFTSELVDAFETGAPTTQAEAVKALVGTRYTGADGEFSSSAFATRRGVLSAALVHAEPDVRVAGLVALRVRGESARSFEHAVALRLSDTDAHVREAAANALDYMPPSEVSIPALLEAIADPVHDVRHRALWAFANHGMGAEVPVELVLREVRAGHAERLSTPEVMILSKHGVASAEALPHLLPWVAQAQGDGNFGRPHAIAALCAVAPGNEEVYERLQVCTWAAYVDTAEAAARGLGLYGERSIPRLTELLDRPAHNDSKIKTAAADGLVFVGEPALPVLIERLDSEHEHTRNAARYAVGRLYADLPLVEEQLRELLRSPSASLRVRGVEAVRALDAPSEALLADLTELLHDPDDSVRRWSADALDTHAAVPVRAEGDLRNMLARDPPWGRLLAARALARLHPNDRALADALRDLIEKHPGPVRLGATNLLKQLAESDDRTDGG